MAEIRAFVESFHSIVSPAMPHASETEQRLAVVHVWAGLFALAMLPELFGPLPDSLAGEEMVARLQSSLFAR